MPRNATVLCISLLVISAVPGCGSTPELEQVGRFQSALQEFDKAQAPEDYLRVAALYQEIIESGVSSGALLYNQGNAYMRAQQRGRALACYRQAARFRPRDEQIRASLRNAWGGADREKRSLLQHLLFWQDWLSYPEKLQGTTFLACLTLCLAVAYIFAPIRSLKWLSLALLIATIVLGLSAAYDWHRFDRVQHGVITTAEVVVRKGDGTTYAPSFTSKLDEGAEFIVLEQRGDWLHIQLAANQHGWVRATEAVVY